MAAQRGQIVTFKQLLSMAHAKGLRSIETEALTIEKGYAFFRAVVTLADDRRYTGHADATPTNCAPAMHQCLPRLAETRAVVRALRLAVNVGEVAAEELPEYQEQATSAPAPRSRPALSETDPITTDQRNAIASLSKRNGTDANERAKELFDASVENLTQAQAAELLQSLQKRAA